MPEDLSREFYTRLSGFRRRVTAAALARAAGWALLRSVPAVALLLAAWRLGRFSCRWFIGAAVVWAGLTAWRFFRTRPDAPTCAKLLDELTNSDTLTVNALDALNRNGRDGFSVYVVRCGIGNFRKWRGELPAAKFRFRELGWLLPLAVAALPLSLPTGGGNASPRRAAEVAPPPGIAAPAARREVGTPQNDFRRTPRHESDAELREAAADRVAGETGTAAAANDAFGAGREAGRNPGRGAGEPAAATDRRTAAGSDPAVPPEHVASDRSGGGMSGDGALGREENAGARGGAAGVSSGDTRMASRSRRTRRPRRRDIGISRGALQPLGADNAPAAGRELAESKDGESGEPDNGRGGESDVKKSRGAAFALPVMPLPDNVTGRLGPGEDMTAVETASPGRTRRESASAEAGAVRREPYVPAPSPPRFIRERIRLNGSDTHEILPEKHGGVK